MPGCDGAGTAERNYPTSEVRDSGLECQALTAQERLRGATPRLRPGAVPESRGGGQKEQPHAQGVVAAWAQEGLEEPSHAEGQKGRCEEIPLIQGKEQQLCFAGAVAVLCWSSCEEIPHAQGKRNPSKMVGVARGHQRADTLKPYSQKSSQSNHTRTIVHQFSSVAQSCPTLCDPVNRSTPGLPVHHGLVSLS